LKGWFEKLDGKPENQGGERKKKEKKVVGVKSKPF